MRHLLLCICLIAYSTAGSQTFNTVTGMRADVPKDKIRVDADTVVLSKSNGQVYTLTVLDVLGRQVMNKQIEPTAFILSSCAFTKGTYTYFIADEKNRVIKRGSFSVEH